MSFGNLNVLIVWIVLAVVSKASIHESWDGLDESGLLVGNGIYFCEMKVGEYRALRKMLVIK